MAFFHDIHLLKTERMTTSTSEIDLLIQNARLRDEMEPYLDESVYLVDLDRMSTVRENEFLTSMLAWEKAPVLPISRWFEPELKLPSHKGFDDAQMAEELDRVVGVLFEQNIVLLQTEHLSDRQLYCLIVRDILPAEEKKMMLPGQDFLRWQCLDIVQDEEAWLRFYASDEERQQWATENWLKLPPREPLPFPRSMPHRIA